MSGQSLGMWLLAAGTASSFSREEKQRGGEVYCMLMRLYDRLGLGRLGLGYEIGRGIHACT